MLKKTITFENLDGRQVTEDFYFNLSKAELAEMEMTKQDGLQKHLERILAAKNGGQIVAAFKEILAMSVGRRSEDGRRFIKNQEITDDFLQSDAYSELFMELISNSNNSTEFFKGIMPSGLVDKAPVATILPVDPPVIEDPEPWITENREPTAMELRTMSHDQIVRAYKNKQNHLPED